MEREAEQNFAQEPAPPGVSVGWRLRLRDIVDIMKEMSRQTDPQKMVKRYGARMREKFPWDGFVSLSRRGIAYPWYRITHSRYIDGVTQAREAAYGPLYGENRLTQAFGASKGDTAALLKAICDDIEVFTTGAEPNDDRRLLIMIVT